MKTRGFTLLLLMTLLAVAAAFVAVRRNEGAGHPASQRALLFPGLEENIASVTRIEIATGEEVQILQRQGYEWTLPGKDHYPADQAHVAQLLSAIATLTVLEEKTSDPARYADLELAPPAPSSRGDAGAGREVKLMDEHGTIVADLIVGRIAVSLGRAGGGYYVRRADNPRSWLAEGAIELPAGLLDWTQRSVFALSDPAAIKTATLTAGGATIVTVGRDNPQQDETFTIAPPPPGTPDQGKALRLVMLPVSLDFTDVRAATAADQPSRSAAFTGFDGTTYRLDVLVSGKDVWAKASEAGPTPGAAQFTERRRGWLYKLPPSRAELLQADLTGFSVKPEAGIKGTETKK